MCNVCDVCNANGSFDFISRSDYPHACVRLEFLGTKRVGAYECAFRVVRMHCIATLVHGQ